jgi:sensor histidine kinase YesM
MKISKKPYGWLLILLRDLFILILIGNFLTLFTYPIELWNFRIVLNNCLFSIAIGYPSWKGMFFLGKLLERKLPWLKYPIKRLVVQVVAMTLFAGIMIFLGMSAWFWLSDEISFRTAKSDVFRSLGVAYIFMILALIVGSSILFFKKWKESTIQQEELKRAHLALQYQSLRDQVRPHFLFNSLSSLVTLINTDTEKATRFVHKLSDVYRYLLEQRETELVPLKQEISFLEDYLYLQNIRFGESLRVSMQLEKAEKRMVIPLSLQMLVENAIKHNEASSGHPLSIDIRATVEQQIVISNTLQPKELPEKSPGLGIENLKKRLAFYTSEPMLVTNGPEKFTVVLPTLPQ